MATVAGGLFDQAVTNSDGSTITASTLLETIGLQVTQVQDGSAAEVVGGGRLADAITALLGTAGSNVSVETQEGATVVKGQITKSSGVVETTAAASITVEEGQEATAQVSFDEGSSIAVTGGAGTAVTGKKAKADTAEAATQVAQEQVAELARSLGSTDEDSAAAREAYNATLAKIIAGQGSDTVVGGTGDDSVTPSGINIELLSISSGSGSRAEGDVTIVGSTEAEGESTVTMLDIFDLQSGASVNISEMESVMLIGGGRVVVTDDTNATIYGDTTDQIIVGGEGNDTLVGGGGSDSLVGGAGENTFGFTSIGNFTIEDFGSSEDLISFGDAGLQSLEDLAEILTGAADVDGNAVFTFFSGENTTTITLVGMSVNDITADMVNFDL